MEALNSYFENLSKFNFISARNDIKLILVDENIPTLFELLNQIVNLEKNYYQLIFVTYKQSGLLGRKKQNESFADAKIQLNEIKTGKKYVNNKCDMIIIYLSILLEHRCNMIELYRTFVNLKTKIGSKVSDALPKLTYARNSLKQESTSGDIKPLDQLLATFTYEVDVLFDLLEAHEKTTNLYFLDPLNAMQTANTNLNQLEQIHRQSEVASTSFSLLTWLRDLNRFVLDKYTLYFHPILSRYSVLTVGYSASPDSFPLVDKIRQFTLKQSPCTATLLFDTTKQSHAYVGHGYVLPRTHAEPLIGLQNYQTIFSTSTIPINQDELFLTVSLIREKIELSSNKKIAHLLQSSQTHKSISYFVCKLDLKIYLTLIFTSQKSEKDKQILTFINDISNELQGTRIMELLKIDQ